MGGRLIGRMTGQGELSGQDRWERVGNRQVWEGQSGWAFFHTM